MTRSRQRLFAVLLIIGGISLAVFLSLMALNRNVTFFYSPSDLIGTGAITPPTDRPFRLGGLVQAGSIRKDGADLTFTVTDLRADIVVHYRGIIPDLFRENQGVVALGLLKNGTFEANELLAKHDEKYMPPDVARALKEKGMDHGQSVP